FAFQKPFGAFDDRHIDHLAVDGDGADALSHCLVIGSHDPASVVGFSPTRAELLIQDLDLAWMDDGGADKAEAARAAHCLAKSLEVAELEDRADKPQRHDTGSARRKDTHLLWH